MSSCSRHENEEAVGFCVNCGDLVCAACHKEIDGKGYCTVCADKLFASTEVKSGQTPPPASAEPTVPAVPSTSRPAPLRAKKAKTEAAPVVQAAKVVEPVILPAKAASEPEKTRIVPSAVKQPVSNLWWLLPLLFTLIGGVIAGLLTKDREPKKALSMFLTGLGMTFVHGIAIIALLAGSVPPPPEQPPTSSTDQTSSVTSAADQQTATSSSNPKTSGTTTAGQTQVGQTPVATDGRDIEVTGPSNTQSESPPPPTDYKLTTLSDQVVQPSDKDQTVSYADKLQVTIPGGQLKESQKLVISAVGNPPAPSSHETQLAVYDISFEKQHEFDGNLTFKFSYDPALVVGDLPPQMALQVAVFDENLHLWALVPSSVDSDSNTITVQTPHNGMWQVGYAFGGDVILTDHCAVFYYPYNFLTPKAARLRELQNKAKRIRDANAKMPTTKLGLSPAEKAEFENLLLDPIVNPTQIEILQVKGKIPSADEHYYTDNPGVPAYVVDVCYFAEQIWGIYKDANKFGIEPYQKNFGLRSANKLNDSSNLVIYDMRDNTGGVSGGKLNDPFHPNPITGESAYMGYVTPVTAFPIYINSDYAEGASYSHLTSSLYIGINRGQVAESLAHELFHAIQHKQYGIVPTALGVLSGGQSTSGWWIESTAEYAAFKIATNNAGPTAKVINSDYLDEDFYKGMSYVGTDNPANWRYKLLGNADHCYINAYFFDYLVQQCDVNFVDMYMDVAGYTMPSVGLNKYLTPINVIDFPDYPATCERYSSFAAYLVMDDKSPIGAISDDEFALSTHREVYTFTNPGGLTCKVKGIKPEVDGNKGNRTLKLTIKDSDYNKFKPYIGGPISYFRVDVYNLEGGLRRPAQEIAPAITWNSYLDNSAIRFPKILGEIQVKPGDKLFIFITADGGVSATTTEIIVEDKYDPQLSIVPPPEIPVGGKGTTCTPYTFEAKGTDMPPGVTYTWYIDDVETSSIDTYMTQVFKPGPHRIKVVAKWGQGDTAGQKDARHAFYIGDPKLTIRGPKELKPGEKIYNGESYTYEVEPEFVPDTATFSWLPGGTGKVFILTPQGAGTGMHLIVYARWDVAGCVGSVESPDMQFDIAELSIDIHANPAVGTEGKETLFTATSPHIPEKFVFSWEITDDDGVTGISTAKMNAPVPHTYTKAGKYSVKVTAVDTQGRTPRATKTIRYLVNPAAGVKIIGPGVTGNINDEYTFIAKSSPMPVGARIEWYFEGGKKYRDTDTVKHTFTTVGDKTVMVQWVIGNEVVPICKDQIQFTVVAAPTLSIKMPGDGKVLQPDKENIFYAVSTSIPGDAVYEWYINEEGVLKAQGREGTVATAPAGFFKEGDYEILVIAKWKGADLKEQWAQADARFKVTTVNISLSIIPPPEIQSKTAQENTKYYFTFNTDIPSTAIFTWYRDGQEVGGGETIGLAFASGQHTVGLKATWRDSDAARTPREQKAKDLSFNIGAATTLPTGHGWYLIKVEPNSQYCSQASCAWSECKDTLPDGYSILGNALSDNPSPPKPCNSQYAVTINWTKLPSFLKPNSDFDCSVTISPSEYVYRGAEDDILVAMAVIDENGYVKDLLYENNYYLGGQQKIWIPDGSRAKVPFSNESKLAGKNLVISFYELVTFIYEYK